MNVQYGGEPSEEYGRQYPHVPGPDHEPHVVARDPGRELPVVVLLADEPGRVDVLDGHARTPSPLEGESLLPVPGDDNDVLGVGIEQGLQVRPRTRRQNGEARTLWQPLRQTPPPHPRLRPRSARRRTRPRAPLRDQAPRLPAQRPRRSLPRG